MDDQEMLRAYAETIKLKDAQIERMKVATAWDSYALREQERSQWKALLTRAAEALEDGVSVKDFDCTKRLKLIQEIRKAAE